METINTRINIREFQFELIQDQAYHLEAHVLGWSGCVRCVRFVRSKREAYAEEVPLKVTSLGPAIKMHRILAAVNVFFIIPA